MKWFDKINSAMDAEGILAGNCLCRHSPEYHRDGRCGIDSCAVECIIPPPPKLVEEARQFMLGAVRSKADFTAAECTMFRNMLDSLAGAYNAKRRACGLHDNRALVEHLDSCTQSIVEWWQAGGREVLDRVLVASKG